MNIELKMNHSLDENGNVEQHGLEKQRQEVSVGTLNVDQMTIQELRSESEKKLEAVANAQQKSEDISTVKQSERALSTVLMNKADTTSDEQGTLDKALDELQEDSTNLANAQRLAAMPAVYNKVFKNRVTAVKKSPGRASLLNNLKDKSTLMASKSSITIIPSIQASSPRTLREEGDTTHSQQPTQHIDSPPVSPTNNSASPRMIRYIKLQNLPTDERPQEPTT